MTPFFVQIKCELGKSYQVANQLAEAEIASEIYSTAGDFDLLVKFYVDSGTDIGHFVNEKVQCISVSRTHTPSLPSRPFRSEALLSRRNPDQVFELRLGQLRGREFQCDGVLHDCIEADNLVRLDCSRGKNSSRVRFALASLILSQSA